jgi:hypothetical protein
MAQRATANGGLFLTGSPGYAIRGSAVRATMNSILGGAKLPNKHFRGPSGLRKYRVWPHPNCLLLCCFAE